MRYTFAEKLAATRAYMKAERRRCYANIALGMAYTIHKEHCPDASQQEFVQHMSWLFTAIDTRAEEYNEAFKRMHDALGLQFYNPRHAHFEYFIDSLANEGL